MHFQLLLNQKLIECYLTLNMKCGNFGALSGICEMLLQSDSENIYLLPALPDKWKNGSVKGLAAKGNVTLDIEWADGKVTDYTIHGNSEKLNIIKCK